MLYDKFGIEYPDESEMIRRKLCAVRYGIYVKRYYGYIPLDLASDIDIIESTIGRFINLKSPIASQSYIQRPKQPLNI